MVMAADTVIDDDRLTDVYTDTDAMTRQRTSRYVVSLRLILALLLVLPVAGWAAPAVPFELSDTYPHPDSAFTQGLIVDGNTVIESSGRYRKSYIARWRPGERVPIQRTALEKRFFAEGLTRVGDRLYLLTWREQRGFIYDATTLQLIDRFRYRGEGWGLTSDGQHLVLSDGSSRLLWLEPDKFQRVRCITVTDDGEPVDRLNELEWIPAGTPLTPDGARLLANRWLTDSVLVIDPASGKVTGELRLDSLFPPASRPRDVDVLNGVAWDPADHTLLVTGKLWPSVYRLTLPAGLP